MKYTNCQKYMNSFPKASRKSDLSAGRIRTLCDALGRVQLGARYICLPGTGAAHAATLLLESVIKQAGHSVGCISATCDFNHLTTTRLSGALPEIELYCRAVTELKSAVLKSGQNYFSEEAVFALGLLLCKLGGCEVILLEGMSDLQFSLDAVCAPYDLIVMPTVYESRGAEALVNPLCAAIRRGTREVVSGNQRSEIYNRIASACVMDGVRLYLPIKSKTTVIERSSRKLVLQYAEKESCTLQSPSCLLTDVAITVIECAFSLRRGGLKLPWSAIVNGFATLNDSGCFETLSRSPDVYIDLADTPEEAALLCKTFEEVVGKTEGLSICIVADRMEQAVQLLTPFKDYRITSLTLYSFLEELEMPKDLPAACDNVTVCKTVQEAAEVSLTHIEEQGILLCFGSVFGTKKLKNEIIHVLNRI